MRVMVAVLAIAHLLGVDADLGVPVIYKSFRG